ncbi:FAD-dependent oxidoreductase [Filomicrobium sp.]|uniref:FAD-dependent oxidoreductase n=1 Tax=Filomicrobium sp. TaxID=2024831 RepID=UPI00259054E1|nr:FAD-dependent oxidoreductase [Filomicrobium sp.]MCV0369399.1 FAD-dependent oxidoreductase [Filomicrobium sp.]
MNVTARAETLKDASTLVDGKRGIAQDPIVVIGGGPAGIRAAQELSRAGKNVIVFNAERWRPYNRVKLTPLLSGEVQLGQVTQSLEFSGPGTVAVYSGHSVVDIDRTNKVVTTGQGSIWPYGKLIICTGSRAHVPPIPGADKNGVYTFRNFDDVEKLVARSFRARRAIVIGGGLLGLEAARGMADRGVDTVVVEHESYLMARQLDACAGELLARDVEAMGIGVRTGSTVSRIVGEDRVTGLELVSGEVLDCDTIIICTGIRPNMELARDVGLAVGRGIKVGPTLQTSDPDVYAAGECAEFNGHVYGLVGPGLDQAAIAARHITGQASTYDGSMPVTKLKVIGTDVFSMGDTEQLDQRPELDSLTYADADGKIYRRLVLKRGRLVGAVAIGDWSEINRLQEAIRKQMLLLPWQRFRFKANGIVWPEREPQSVRDWPRAATVCNCTGVTRGQIGDAIALGAGSLDDIKRDTGASTVCGSCKIHIGELLGAPPKREPAGAATAIAVTSGIAAILAALILVLPIWSTATTITGRGLPELLFLDGITKQISGYVLLALSVLAVVLSVRKRVPILRKLGGYAGWRVFHILIGVTALAVLAAHTGFRLGDNLNLWLMASFLTLALAGVAAGIATALEHRLFGNARTAATLKDASFWLHLLAFWPLPTLLSLHILSVYFY